MATESKEDPDLILDGYLRKDESVEHTVQQLTKPIEFVYEQGDPSNSGPDSAETLLWNLWDTIFTRSQDVADTDDNHQQTRLTDLLSAIKARDSPELSEQRLKAVEGFIPWSVGDLWHDLVLWGWATRETFDVLDPSGVGAGQADADQWINVNTFLAKLTARKIYDHSFLGISVIRAALEKKAAVDANRNTNASLGIAVAASWIEVVGQKWYEEGWTSDTLTTNPDPASLWNGPPFEIDRDRLVLWRSRLEELSQTFVEAKWKPMIDNAVRRLTELEGTK